MSTIDDNALKTYMTDTYGFDDKDFVYNEASVIEDMKDNRSQALYDAYENDTEVVQADTTDATKGYVHGLRQVIDTTDATKGYVHGLRQVIDTMTAHMNKKIDTPHKDAIIAEAMQIGNGSAADTKFGYKELVQNIVDVLERYDISSDNNKGNTSKDDATPPPSYTFDVSKDLHILDTQDGTDDDVIAKQDVLDTYIDAFKEANKTNPEVTDTEITYIKGIVKTMFEKGGSVYSSELYSLISQFDLSKTTDITKGSYTFNFDEKSADYKADFEALDTFKNTKDNDKISKEAIMNYIDAFATKENSTDNQIKNLKDKATNYYNSDKHISLSEFKKLTREMKKL